MQSKATTVAEYLATLPQDRRKALEVIRKEFRKNLDEGFKEGMQYGMIGYFVPHRIFEPGYHADPKQPLPFAAIAAQKRHLAIYLMHLHMDPAEEKRFRQAWEKTGKCLDMGKSCIRFRKVEDVPLGVLGAAIKKVRTKDYVALYTKQLERAAKARRRPT